MLSLALGTVLVPPLVAAAGRGDRAAVHAQSDAIARRLTAIFVGLFGVLVIVSPLAIAVVWGAEYAKAATVLPILLVAVMLASIALGAATTLVSTRVRGPRAVALVNVSGLVVSLAVWPFLAPSHGTVGVALGYLIGSGWPRSACSPPCGGSSGSHWLDLAAKLVGGTLVVLVLAGLARRVRGPGRRRRPSWAPRRPSRWPGCCSTGTRWRPCGPPSAGAARPPRAPRIDRVPPTLTVLMTTYHGTTVEELERSDRLHHRPDPARRGVPRRRRRPGARAARRGARHRGRPRTPPCASSGCPRNVGSGLASARGLELATGDFVARHDSDDVSLPHRLEREMEAVEQHHLDLVGVGDARVRGAPPSTSSGCGATRAPTSRSPRGCA